jgi:pyrroloquinoline-quinone synthase
MSFLGEIQNALRPFHLLSHPFYQAWTRGELTLPELRHYSVQYLPFVEAFPRFVSALHSHCEDKEARAEIFENLMDEEGQTGRSKPHPELWRGFMDGLGAAQDGTPYCEGALALKSTFLQLCQSSYAEALCALYAYEYQTPEISKTKIEGLEKFYGLTDAGGVEFFRVHEAADLYHSATCEKLIGALPADQQDAALLAARKAAESLWNFLSAVYEDKMTECAVS